MTIMNPLPPQAYTKETLVQAYAWLQGQNDHIKEIATTPDVLVSLYLKAKLQGDGALERPSIQNFKNELRNLAGMMGEFEVPEQEPIVQRTQPPPNHQTIRFRSQDLKTEKLVERQQAPERNYSSGGHTASGPTQSHAPAAHASQQHSTQAVSFSASFSQSSASQASASNPTESLDARSKEMIQEVKNHFNLSSDMEAFRLLIAAGYNQVKNLLK